ncbi:MAG TPA: LytTR family DNA-binding domain-containing protein [Steroidobacteraceae bacterium]
MPLNGNPGRLRTLVVDDEPLARRNLCLLLRRDPDIATVDECGSGAEAIVEIRSSRPDLVFLDVQMPECDGFDVLELLGSDQPAVVVFVTAYDDYALRAFEAGALDYLLKPFTDTRFQLALERAKQRVAHYREGRPRGAEPLIIKSSGQVVFVNISEIDWIEAANYYTCLHVGPNTHVLRRSLAALERELQSGPFCRIHRSTIVNVDRISSLELMNDGEYAVVVKGGTRLRLSRGFRKSLQQRLGLRRAGP